jgi:glycosyltransferase involved in cell wall biosynthesis
MAHSDNQTELLLLPHVVIVTDVHYWRRLTGAQQRIFALVEFLRQRSTKLTTVFAGSLENSSASDDRVQITAAGLDVVSLIDDWRPEGWLGRFKWQLNCTVNGLLNRLNPARKTNTLDRSSPPRRLADFRTPLLVKRLNAQLKILQPKIVIVEYVTLAYLVANRARRAEATYVVDTHDVLSSRCEQFRDHGFDHWVELTAEEESVALRLFDLVIAIEAQEALRFGELIDHQRPVVVAGHPVEWSTCPPITTPANEISVGYFASGNAANRHALIWFFEKVWPEVHRKLPQVEFLIAGTIGETLMDESLPDQVRLLGSVDQPVDFYRAVNVVVNPIQFGTGLKIKNLEALAFGKPLVTTVHGGAGMSDSEFGKLPCFISDSAQSMVAQLIQICTDEELRNRTCADSAQFVSQQLTPEKVFGPLLQRLKSLMA